MTRIRATKMVMEYPAPTKTFTLGEILDALERNGFKQETGSFLRFVDNKQYLEGAFESELVGACALGQAALNLGIDYTGLDVALHKISLSKKSLSDGIIHLNDTSGWSVSRIGKHYKKLLKDKLDMTVVIPVYREYTVIEEE